MSAQSQSTLVGLHRWRLTTYSYLLLGIGLLVFRAARLVDPQMPLLTIFSGLAIAHLGVYLLIRQGWSRLLSDPSMSASQMVQAIIAVTLLMHYSGPMRGAMMSLYFIILINGVLVLKQSTQLLLAGFAVTSVTLLHLYEWQFAPIAPSGIEIAQLLILSLGLLWFCYIGGFMYQLQQRTRDQKHQLRAQQQLLSESNSQLQIALHKVEEIARKDPLTGAYNRRYFMEQLEQEIHRARRHNTPLPLAVIDLDFFKQINDQYGHGMGDQILQLFVESAHQILRQNDCVARFGGEEFVAYFPHTQLHDARKVLERLQHHFAKQGKTVLANAPTFSAGLSLLSPQDTSESLIQRTDAALYQAKDEGRNRLVISASDD